MIGLVFFSLLPLALNPLCLTSLPSHDFGDPDSYSFVASALTPKPYPQPIINHFLSRVYKIKTIISVVLCYGILNLITDNIALYSQIIIGSMT